MQGTENNFENHDAVTSCYKIHSSIKAMLKDAEFSKSLNESNQ